MARKLTNQDFEQVKKIPPERENLVLGRSDKNGFLSGKLDRTGLKGIDFFSVLALGFFRIGSIGFFRYWTFFKDSGSIGFSGSDRFSKDSSDLFFSGSDWMM